MTATYEQNLQELLAMIQGTRWPYAKGLWSHKSSDPEQQGLHQACLELERRGALYRQHDNEHITAWLPVEPCPAKEGQ